MRGSYEINPWAQGLGAGLGSLGDMLLKIVEHREAQKRFDTQQETTRRQQDIDKDVAAARIAEAQANRQRLEREGEERASARRVDLRRKREESAVAPLKNAGIAIGNPERWTQEADQATAKDIGQDVMASVAGVGGMSQGQNASALQDRRAKALQTAIAAGNKIFGNDPYISQFAMPGFEEYGGAVMSTRRLSPPGSAISAGIGAQSDAQTLKFRILQEIRSTYEAAMQSGKQSGMDIAIKGLDPKQAAADLESRARNEQRLQAAAFLSAYPQLFPGMSPDDLLGMALAPAPTPAATGGRFSRLVPGGTTTPQTATPAPQMGSSKKGRFTSLVP